MLAVSEKKPRTRSLFSRIFVLLVVLLLIQAVIFPVVFQYGGFFDQLKGNALSQIKSINSNRILYLESDFVSYYQSIYESYGKIFAIMDEVLQKNNCTYEDIATNARLNEEIMASLASEIIYLLRRNDATGAYIILEGPAIADVPSDKARAGFSVSNSAHTALVRTNEGLLLENGFPTLSQSLGIALSSYWSAAVTFEHQLDPHSADYYFKTIEAIASVPQAERVSGIALNDYAFWCAGYSSKAKSTKDNLYYTLPLISPKGDILGGVGICFNATYLLSLLNYRELSNLGMGAYALCLSSDNGETLNPVFTFGPSYKHFFTDLAPIQTSPTAWDGISALSTNLQNGNRLFAAINQLNLYNTASPFGEEAWYLVAMVDENSLFSFVNRLQVTMLSLSLSFFCLAFIMAIFFSRMITKPIGLLVADLKKSDPYKRISLRRINVTEIDDLTSSIEALSDSVSESASKLNKIIDMAGGKVGVYEYVDGNDTVFVSSAFIKLLNLPIDHDHDTFLPAPMFFEHLTAVKKQCVFMDMENTLQISTPDGSIFYVRLSHIQEGNNSIGMAIDITEETSKQLQTLYERDFDVLTDLYNVRAFTSKVSALFQSPDQLKTACVVMFDLDNLKHFNDTYGHDIGDLYIKTLSDRLKSFEQHGGICARRSGDEFLVFLYGYDSPIQMRSIINDVLADISQARLSLPDHTIEKIRVSAGIAWYPTDTVIFEELLRYADFAMYESKRTRKGGVMDFVKEHLSDSGLLVTSTNQLDHMLDERLIRFAFQPIVKVSDASVYGYELLMRPQSPHFSSPFDVLRVATAQGKLYRIEALTWMEGMSAYVNNVLNKTISSEAHIFINSIANEWLDPNDYEHFVSTFRPYLHRIVLELTESEPLNLTLTAKKIATMHSLGALFALDDFGSGYASESTLLEVRPDIIKIDMSIIRNVDTTPGKLMLLDNLIRYAKLENIKVLAEGVETRSEMEVLVAHGVDYLQGYFVAKPSLDHFTVSEDVLACIQKAYLANL